MKTLNWLVLILIGVVFLGLMILAINHAGTEIRHEAIQKSSPAHKDGVQMHTPDNTHRITIQPWEGGVGIFVEEAQSRYCVTIVSNQGHAPFVGLRDPNHQAALVVAAFDEEGKPTLKLVARDGAQQELEGERLLKEPK